MLLNSLEFACKRGIEAFNLLFNLLTLNKPKAIMVCIDAFKLQAMIVFNQKLLRMLHGAVFSKRAPLAAGGMGLTIYGLWLIIDS
jgi:hypothetical protein